jgi:hypothetical protein
MATRMTTLLDDEDPGLGSIASDRAESASRRAAPRVVPMRPFALRGLMLGMAAAAAVFAGLALCSAAAVWGSAMTPFARICLMVVGGYLLAGGVAYVAAAHPEAAHR